MLLLILIDVQYSQKAVCSFEKSFICQNHSSSSSLHPVKKILLVKFTISPTSAPPHSKMEFTISTSENKKDCYKACMFTYHTDD